MDETNAPVIVDETDWERIARTGLANGAQNGLRVNRRQLSELCRTLAAGTPLETASRLIGIQPNSIREWAGTRPTAWAAVEKARAAGELLCIRKIANANDWKAADRLLTLQRPEYGEGGAATGSAPIINVTINVPVPRQIEVGSRTMVDVTPQRTLLDVDAAVAVPVLKPSSR